MVQINRVCGGAPAALICGVSKTSLNPPSFIGEVASKTSLYPPSSHPVHDDAAPGPRNSACAQTTIHPQQPEARTPRRAHDNGDETS